jgi:pSer/pThr/pTyr-binding forkhead associated (FHA) protein/outer membrane biosynthesis protein TonB
LKQPIVLRIYRGEQLVAVKQFNELQVVIGRQSESQLLLEGERVSLIHAAIEERDGQYYITDLGSETGTFKNGDRILDAKLTSGDMIQIGDNRVEFNSGAPKPKAVETKPTDIKTADVTSIEAKTADIKPSEEKPLSIVQEISEGKANKVVTEVERVAPQPILKSVSQVPVFAAAVTTAAVTTAAVTTSTAPSTAVRSGFKKKKKGRKTFAPQSIHKSIKEYIKPTKGTVVEVLVAWRERVIEVQHYTNTRIVTVGSHPESDIIVPLVGLSQQRMPVVKIDGKAIVIMAPGTTGEFVKGQTSTAVSEMLRSNRVIIEAQMQTVVLEQGELAKIDIGGEVSVVIRYVPDTPRPLVPPLIDLAATDFIGIMLPLVLTALLALYTMVYNPSKGIGEDDEPIRVATLIAAPTPVPTPPPPIPTPQVAKATPAPVPVPTPKSTPVVVKATPEPKKIEPPKQVTQVKKSEIPNPKKDPGKAANAAPTRNKDAPQTVTSSQKGGSIKLAKKEGAQMQAKTIKPEKSGVFSVFGSGGQAQRLNESSSGVGELAGTASASTGTTGSNINRAGIGIGSDIKDTGAGGTGRAAVGIKGGIFGEGRGTSAGGTGVGGTGITRASTKVQVGGNDEGFSGSIDRDAIRRLIQANLKVIRSCYERELNRNPNLYGKLVVQWDIGANGQVVSGPIAKQNDLNATVAECVSQRMRSWKFPDPPAGQVVTVTYPFVFSN